LRGIPLDVCPSCRKKENLAKRHAEVRSKYGDNMICEDCGNKYSLNSNSFKARNRRHDSIKKCRECLLISKYGVHHLALLQSVKDAKKRTLMDRYGVENPSQIEGVQDKVRKTTLERYGVENISKSEEYKERKRETAIRNYGVPNPMILLNPKARSIQEISFMKRLNELFVNGTLFDRGYSLITDLREISRTLQHPRHMFDALILKDGKPDTVVDYDGKFHHADAKFEYDGHWAIEHLDATRISVIPIPNVKMHIIVSDKEDEGLKELVRILDFDYSQWITDQFNQCKAIPFPYYSYNNEELVHSYNKLMEYVIDNEHSRKLQGRSGVGDHIITHFHKSIWHCRCENNPTPYEAWHDDKLLFDSIKNRFIYFNNCNPKKVLQGFSVNRIAPRVTIFSALKAKYIVTRYLNEYDTIFDPFSGFSSRMLGTIAAGKKYIGVNSNPIITKESNNIINYFNLNDRATVKCDNILNMRGKFECLFTCVPSGDKEKYGKETIFKFSDEWIDICVNNFDCKRYIFVTDNTIRYSNYIAERSINESHFGSSSESIIIIDKIDNNLISNKLSILRLIVEAGYDNSVLYVDSDYMAIPENRDLWEKLPLDMFKIIE
jgi:hypothetical protein